MASLENHKPNDSLQSDDDDENTIHFIDISNGLFPEQIPHRIESGDTIEFKTNKTDEYDVFQVYKDEDDYYRINNGFELYNIKNNTTKNNRRILLSLDLQQPKIELYFCILPSSQREIVIKSRKCSNENCEKNCLIVHKSEIKFSLGDNKESQKLVLHKGDTIELDWASKRGNGYRIEENKYCPISGGLYKVEQTTEITTNRALSKGNFTKTFKEFGTSFLFRLTETNQIHDIIVCIIKDNYHIKYIEITDTNIQPNIISIEQNDSIIFQWNTTQKQTIVQIEPFIIDPLNQQSIELKTEGKHFFWPNEPSCRGYMIHKFHETGIFCFKTANNQIGTIIVEPKINIHSFPIFGDQLILKMKTTDLIQFEWKMTDSQDEPILITIDANSSVVPDVAGGLTGIFDCSMHKCVKVEPFFRHHFHTCEAFIINIPQHGLYNFAYSDNRDDVVLSVIVENSIANHRVTYNEQNMFEPHTLVINRYDQVWFNSISTTLTNIYQTDEYGNHLEENKPVFQPQLNSMNCFMQQLRQTGIYYFSNDISSDDEKKSFKAPPLAVIVLPEIRFHYKLIRLSDFDSQTIITTVNDFIIWEFEQIIRFNVIQLRSNETLQDLISCHDRAIPGRNRQCLAVECIMPGTFHFANPEFERVTGSDQDRLISTIIIDPPFSHACFLITDQQFIPNFLCIAQNDTVSWILLNSDQYHRIYVESDEKKREMNEDNRIDRSIEQYVNDVHYLYTFDQCGQYTIRSNRFNETVTVIVYPDDIIRSQKKRTQQPELIEELDIASQYGTKVHLQGPNQDATIYYTLDGTLPTRHYKNVYTYDSNKGISFTESGLHVLRAYATENGKLSSAIFTSSPTFVMENEELDMIKELRAMWNDTKITISAAIHYPNKLYGKIDVEPTNSTDLIDRFELYVDDVAQRVNLSATDVKFSAEGFAGGEQYEIHVVAYPKQNIVDAEPISSNKRAFEIKREIQGGAPLISLAVSNEQSTIFLMWAHIGDHVSEYVVYVDSIETTTILEKDFNDFFGIQFHGAQQTKRYILHVEAKLKNNNEIRKSNIITVNPPLEMPLKEQLIDRYFAYITVNAESPPPDMRLEVFVQALFTIQELSETKYFTTTSNEVKIERVIPLIDLLPRPILTVTRIGLQMANFSWKLENSVDQSLIKGFRIILNKKPTEIFSSNQYEYELRNIKSGTINDVEVSITCYPDFIEEKLSNSIRIICPRRPQPLIIQSIQNEKPFSIGIKWKIDNNNIQDEITSFKIFLDGKLHCEIDTNRRHSFKYEFAKLQADQTYSIYVKSCIGQKKLEDNVYQCDIESNTSNELVLKCFTPPKGTPPRIERMYPNGIDIVWDAPIEFGNVKVTVLSIHDLEVGNQYLLQVVPLTNQSGSIPFQTGEEYDPERHIYCLPGPKLDVDFTDLVQSPSKFWIENISGHSAVVCWSANDSSNVNIQPDSYKLFIWNSKEQTRDQATVIPISKDKRSQQLKDLQSATTYEIQLEAYKRRRHKKTNDAYIVSATSKILKFETGAPPDAPTNINIIACTNTGVRIGFDPFIEHSAEIIALRIYCESISSLRTHTKEIILDLTPDSTEFILSNLIERTDYNLTIYAITDEYLHEIHCRDISQLPKKLKSSYWLTNKSIQFTTSGCEPASQIHITSATIESIQLNWILPKVYGSTKYLGQILRWKLQRSDIEHSMELDCNITNTIIPGILALGLYKISLDSLFSMKITLDDEDDEINRKEIRLTTTEITSVRYRFPGLSEKPEIYLTGYTNTTIDLTWNKPNMFSIIDHPERLNQQIKIHRRLIGYRVEINGQKYNTLDKDQYQCTLTECQPGEDYKVQLIVQSVVQNEYMDDLFFNDNDNDEEPDETISKKIHVPMLNNQDLLRSFQANFEFHHNVTKENTIQQRNEVKPLGKINVHWTVSNIESVSHFILQWHSSKDLRIQQRALNNNETSFTIDARDEKHFYIIEIIIVTHDGIKHQYEPLKMPIPGEPDAPKLWLVKTSDSSFIVEWSEPKSYGIPVIGFQLYIEGKQAGDTIAVNLHRAEIPSNINRTYQVSVCAITNNPERSRSAMSHTLSVLTTPPTNPIPTMYHNHHDNSSKSFHRNIVVRTIPIQIESITEEKLQIDWTSFLPTIEIRAYYIHYTCLNNGEIQTIQISTRHRNAILRDLIPGFTYEITVVAVDKDGDIVYKSDINTIQMSAPPNAPIVAIRERTNDHVTFEWRPAPSYGELAVVGYKIYINNRLVAILSHDQLTYTLTNGSACEEYTAHVQALSNDKNISSPMSRGVIFTWPGIKPGAFTRLDDGLTGTVVVAWEHPQLEDETEKLIRFKIFSENVTTHAIRLHGEYNADTHQATIYDLIHGKYHLWLEIQSEHYCVRTRPITIGSGRFRNRQLYGSAKCFMKKQKRFRSTGTMTMTPTLRQIQYS
ncbi:unnamed protein product [Rotaria sp. Silwood1]|nr:unnamed protein product [Rotaria sp. Silwood1]